MGGIDYEGAWAHMCRHRATLQFRKTERDDTEREKEREKIEMPVPLISSPVASHTPGNPGMPHLPPDSKRLSERRRGDEKGSAGGEGGWGDLLPAAG